jgi:predicted glycoside hydrolase/deacetylase ChbG (UPF0249 family)
MTTPRRLIVNADDFGRSASINEGIIRCHERGVVTSASLMVRWPDAVEAGDYAQAHPELSVGLHFDLGEWEYVDYEWRELYAVASPSDEEAVAAELASQLDRFTELTGRNPTHLDSHQHVHRDPVTARLVVAAGRRLGVPVRDLSDLVRYSGSFYGQTGNGYTFPEYISVEALTKIIETLEDGWTELGCHPGTADDVPGMYGTERLTEIETLCDASIPGVLARTGVQLGSFHELAAAP